MTPLLTPERPLLYDCQPVATTSSSCSYAPESTQSQHIYMEVGSEAEYNLTVGAVNHPPGVSVPVSGLNNPKEGNFQPIQLPLLLETRTPGLLESSNSSQSSGYYSSHQQPHTVPFRLQNVSGLTKPNSLYLVESPRVSSQSPVTPNNVNSAGRTMEIQDSQII